MQIETEVDANNFYNSFSGRRSFSIRKHKAGVVKKRTFVHSKESQHGPDKRNKIVRCHRDKTRTGCESYMLISFKCKW